MDSAAVIRGKNPNCLEKWPIKHHFLSWINQIVMDKTVSLRKTNVMELNEMDLSSVTSDIGYVWRVFTQYTWVNVISITHLSYSDAEFGICFIQLPIIYPYRVRWPCKYIRSRYCQCIRTYSMLSHQYRVNQPYKYFGIRLTNWLSQKLLLDMLVQAIGHNAMHTQNIEIII